MSQPVTVHAATHIGLQRGLNVCQEQEFRVFVLLGNLGMESLKYVQVGVIGLRLAEVVSVGSAPTEGLPFRALQAANIDTVIVKYLLLRGAEVLADDRNDAHGREVTGSEREVGCGTTKDIFHAA